jgi:hypothetical protein
MRENVLSSPTTFIVVFHIEELIKPYAVYVLPILKGPKHEIFESGFFTQIRIVTWGLAKEKFNFAS